MVECLLSDWGESSQFSQAKFDRAQQEIAEDIAKFAADIPADVLSKIKANALALDMSRNLIKYRRTLDIGGEKRRLEELEKRDKELYAGLSDAEKRVYASVDDRIYYLHRRGADFALRWPINYMDVFPFAKDSYSDIIKTICTRDTFAIQSNMKQLKTPPICHVRSYIPFQGVDQQAMARVVKEYVNKCALAVLSALPKTIEEPTITYHFTAHRTIEKTSLHNLAAGSIHVFGLYYDFCGWAANEINIPAPLPDEAKTKRVEKIREAISLNYKIASFLSYDILHSVIRNAPCDLSVYLADDSLAGLSYFFTRLAHPRGIDKFSACDLGAKFVFVGGAEPVAQPRKYTISTAERHGVSINDIISVQAYYFRYNHEIFRKNVPLGGRAPPFFMDDTTVTVANLDLFEKMKALRETVFANVKLGEITYKMPTDEELPKSPPSYTLIIASPGTGKSTYLDKNCQNALKINFDDIMINSRFGGKTYDEVRQDAIGSANFATLGNSRLEEVLRQTLYFDLHEFCVLRYSQFGNNVMNELRKKYIKKCAICEETAGRPFSKYPFTGTNFDTCGDVELLPDNKLSEPFIEVDPDVPKKAIVIHIPPIKQYTQVLHRSLREDRILRYYKLLRFNKLIQYGMTRSLDQYLELYYGVDSRHLVAVDKKLIPTIRQEDPDFIEFIIRHRPNLFNDYTLPT